MSGVKGRSGRKPRSQEILQMQATDLSAKTILDILRDPKISKLDKGRFALPTFLKTLPDKLEVKDVNALSYAQRCELADQLERIMVNGGSTNASTAKVITDAVETPSE